MSQDKDLRSEVLAANAEVNAAAIADRPIKNMVKAPVRPEASWAEAKRVDRAFNREQYGEADLIKFFFNGLVVRDNLASSPSKSIFDDVYAWTGAVWKRDTDHRFKAELDIIGQAFHLRAWSFYDEAAEKFLPNLETPEASAPPETPPPEATAPAQPDPEPQTQNKKPYKLEKLKDRAKDKELTTPELQGLVKKGDEYMARARKCWTLQRQTQTANLACSGEGSLAFSGTWNDFDRLVPCPNGTFDLDTGDFITPRPEHYFNKIIPWDYLGTDIPCPTWKGLLNKCLGHDQALLEYFELVMGSCLIGQAPKNIFVAYGPKANNAKSTIFGTMGKLLGGFAVSLGPELLLVQPPRNSDAPRPGLVRMRGVRAAFLKEAKAQDWFDLGQLKGLTGGDEQSERTLNNDDYKDFDIKATLVLHSNHIPRVAGLDRGFQNRLVVLPFLSQFFEDPEDLAAARDKGEKHIFLAEPRDEINRRLKKEMSGILGWAIASAQKLLISGGRLPPPPPICREQAEEYLYENDLPGQFIEAMCIQGPGHKTTFKKIYKAFKEWCEGERDMTASEISKKRKTLAQALRVRFPDPKKSNGDVIYMGIDLKPEYMRNMEADRELF